MKSHKHAIIVMIVRNDVKVHELKEHMSEDTATIWVKVGSNRSNNIIIGGVYIQHQILGITPKDATQMEKQLEQEKRWEKIVKKWSNVSRNNMCVVLGDINLNHQRWSNPERHLEKMADLTKQYVEGNGFSQLIQGITRTWRTHTDSLLDHVWSNCGHRTVRVFNEDTGASDHNLIGLEISLKDVKEGGHHG